MTLFYLRWRSNAGPFVDDDTVHNGLESARIRAECIAEMTERPVQIINDWDGSVVEVVGEHDTSERPADVSQARGGE